MHFQMNSRGNCVMAYQFIIRKSCVILLTILLTSLHTASRTSAQQTDPAVLTPERIFTLQEFNAERFGPARWLEGGAAYATIEPSATIKGGSDIVRYDCESGRRNVLIAAGDLIPSGQTVPLSIEEYEWSADGRLLLIFTNSKRVWRQNTRGDYWVLDRQTRKLNKLGGSAEASSLMFAKFSPDATRVGYVSNNTLFAETLADHSVIQLSVMGSRTLINGTFDWAYEEELDLRDGWRWSPDGKMIAYWQLDAEGVRDFYLLNNTDSLYPAITAIPYPKVGETNSAARIGIVSADGGETRWLEIPGEPRNQYLARMEWVPGTSQVIVQRLNRLQNRNDVMLAEGGTGKLRTVLTESDETWVDVRVAAGLNWIDGGRRFLWLSERDGWRHVYIASRDDGKLRLITPGNFDVIGIEGVNENEGWLYYAASPDDPTQRSLYRTRLDGQGKAERLSPLSQRGWHTYNLSPDCHMAFHTFSQFNNPPRTGLVRLPQHQDQRSLADNEILHERMKKLRLGSSELFRVKAGEGLELDGWIIKPPDFDAQKRYPILFYVYGEPARQTVVDQWGDVRHLWHLMLSQQGYLVVSVDNRGTPAPRGRAWRKAIYRKIGVISSEDQAAAARQILAWPYVDASRVAVWGWSGGGSMTLNLMFRYPEIYKAGLSVAPVSDQRLYDSIYQERYMGLPQQNDEDYRRGSPITYVDGLKGKLLIVHGTGDDNVHYQSTERLINALIAVNKEFSMMSYPNRSHIIIEGQNTRRHLYELLTRYLNENIRPGPALH